MWIGIIGGALSYVVVRYFERRYKLFFIGGIFFGVCNFLGFAAACDTNDYLGMGLFAAFSAFWYFTFFNEWRSYRTKVYVRKWLYPISK